MTSAAPATREPIVNALTIDFEDWYHGIEIPPERWGDHESRIALAGRRTLEVLAVENARATFFVLGAVAERDPHLVREIAAAGHEIATHGWSHTFVYRLTPETFREEIRRSVALLEDLGGRPVRGFRAPYFSITKDSLWALPILAEQGIRYDSSIFPVQNYRYGIEDAPRWPYVHELAEGRVAEFPITTWNVLGKNLPISGGAYFRIYPYGFSRHGLREINREGRPFVFYLHPWELDPAHPRIPLPRRVALTHYFNLGSTERRLRRLLRDFRFAPMQEVLNVD